MLSRSLLMKTNDTLNSRPRHPQGLDNEMRLAIESVYVYTIYI